MQLENVCSTLHNNIFISRFITPNAYFLFLAEVWLYSIRIYCYWNFYHSEIMKGFLGSIGTVYLQLLKLYAS